MIKLYKKITKIAIKNYKKMKKVKKIKNLIIYLNYNIHYFNKTSLSENISFNLDKSLKIFSLLF